MLYLIRFLNRFDLGVSSLCSAVACGPSWSIVDRFQSSSFFINWAFRTPSMFLDGTCSVLCLVVFSNRNWPFFLIDKSPTFSLWLAVVALFVFSWIGVISLVVAELFAVHLTNFVYYVSCLWYFTWWRATIRIWRISVANLSFQMAVRSKV